MGPRPNPAGKTDAQFHEEHSLAGYAMDGRCRICYPMQTQVYDSPSEPNHMDRVYRGHEMDLEEGRWKVQVRGFANPELAENLAAQLRVPQAEQAGLVVEVVQE